MFRPGKGAVISYIKVSTKRIGCHSDF